MKVFFILPLLFSLSFSQSNIDSEKYKEVMQKATKESFTGMVKDYQKNAENNFKNLQKDDIKMREKYNIKGIGGKNRKEYKIKFIEDKFSSVKAISLIQKNFIKSNNLNSLFVSMLDLKALFTSNVKITKTQAEKYKLKVENNKNSSSFKFYRYKSNFALELNEIQYCYLNAIDFSALSKCEKQLNNLKNSDKVNRFITNYMK